MNIDSPSAGAEPSPAFTNIDECRQWLAKAQAADAVQMHAMLLRQVSLLNRFALAAGERFAILELLREPIHEAQEELGRKFAGKPLPLPPPDQAALDSCRALWHGLATGYMRCAEACSAGEPDMKSKTALTLQRALAALVAEQFETHRASQIPSSDHWRMLHQLYGTAELLGAAASEVEDRLRLGKVPGSPAAAYVESMLLQAASLHEHSQRKIGWIARWARRWAGKVQILTAAPAAATQAMPLCVDIASDRPAAYLPPDTDSARWLDTAELRRSLKKRIVLLEQGESPAKLHLGNDCTQPACEQLLKHIYQRWCKGGAIRGFERRPASGSCRIIVGAEAIHYYLSDHKPFKPPGSADVDMLRREREEIATFGRVSTHRDEHFSEQQGYTIEEWETLENWHMVDASATGLRIGRPLRQNGARLAHGHLIAARPVDAQAFLLGNVRWVLADDNLQIGLHFFPGLPEPVAVRGTGSATIEKYRQGFLLPDMPAVKQEASIVMPVGTFKLGKMVEILTDKTRQLRLTRLVERGADYERAIYEPV